MSLTNAVTLIGNIADEPQLRFTQTGVPVAGFTLATTERVYDRASGEWKDGDTAFVRCTAWRNAGAENLIESLTKGARAIVTGKLKQRSFTTDDGNKRTVIELEAEEIGASLKYAVATPVKNPRKTQQAPETGGWGASTQPAGSWGAPAGV
jgi:single-strand DNA-binding protein